MNTLKCKKVTRSPVARSIFAWLVGKLQFLLNAKSQLATWDFCACFTQHPFFLVSAFKFKFAHVPYPVGNACVIALKHFCNVNNRSGIVYFIIPLHLPLWGS